MASTRNIGETKTLTRTERSSNHFIRPPFSAEHVGLKSACRRELWLALNHLGANRIGAVPQSLVVANEACIFAKDSHECVFLFDLFRDRIRPPIFLFSSTLLE